MEARNVGSDRLYVDRFGDPVVGAGQIGASCVFEALHDAGADGISDDHEYLRNFVVAGWIVELAEGSPDAERDAGAPAPDYVADLAACLGEEPRQGPLSRTDERTEG